MPSKLIASCIRIPSLCLHIPLYLCFIICTNLTRFHILNVAHTDAVNMDAQIFQRFWIQLFGIRSESQKWSSWIIQWFYLCFMKQSLHFPFANEPLIFLLAALALMIFCHLLRNSHHNRTQVVCTSFLVSFHFPNDS